MNVCTALAGASVVFLCTATGPIASAQTLYRGLDLNNPPTTIPMVSTPNHDDARTDFLNDAPAWATSHTLNINALPNGAIPPTLNFGNGLLATVNIATLGQIRSAPFSGAHSISGGSYISAEANPGQTYLRLTFNQPILAIGFTHTDLMDQVGTGLTGPTPRFQIIDDPMFGSQAIFTNDPVTVRNASVGYFGVHAASPFTTFSIFRPPGGSGGRDIAGFENFTVFVPTPGTLALLSIAGLAAVRRKRTSV